MFGFLKSPTKKRPTANRSQPRQSVLNLEGLEAREVQSAVHVGEALNLMVIPTSGAPIQEATVTIATMARTPWMDNAPGFTHAPAPGASYYVTGTMSDPLDANTLMNFNGWTVDQSTNSTWVDISALRFYSTTYPTGYAGLHLIGEPPPVFHQTGENTDYKTDMGTFAGTVFATPTGALALVIGQASVTAYDFSVNDWTGATKTTNNTVDGFALEHFHFLSGGYPEFLK